ncbi:hypothetical protein GCM10007979_26750 [Nocardioides albus]|nr:hypothetical protein GCM10007979_26750 [Nocardioides albus]
MSVMVRQSTVTKRTVMGDVVGVIRRDYGKGVIARDYEIVVNGNDCDVVVVAFRRGRADPVQRRAVTARSQPCAAVEESSCAN